MDYFNDSIIPRDIIERESHSNVSDCLCGKGNSRNTRMSKPDETPDCSDNKSCFFEDFKIPSLNGFPLVMTYCPVQPFENVYDTEFGFSRGTIFKCLDLPFEKSACDKKNSCSCRQR